MSRNQRIGLVLAAVAIAVVGFLIASPGGDDEDQQAAQTTPAETSPADDAGARTETETETEAEAEPPPPPKPEITRIRIRAGAVAGGSKEIDARTGDTVRIVVAADAPDEIHLHGYDITKGAAPGHPARFVFKATLEGVFELESHTAEDAGKDPLVARLLVKPS